MTMLAADRQEKLEGLIERYRGEFSEEVFTASILYLVPDRDERRHLIFMHQAAHRAALPLARR